MDWIILCHDSMLWTNNFILFPDLIRYGLSYFVLCRDSIRYVLDNFILFRDSISNWLKILLYIMIRCYGLIILFCFLIRYVMDLKILFYVMVFVLLNNRPKKRFINDTICVEIFWPNMLGYLKPLQFTNHVSVRHIPILSSHIRLHFPRCIILQ